MNKLTPLAPRETVMSSRAFNQDTGKAKKAARQGPVIITDRGEPAYVLMSIDAYSKLKKPKKSLYEALVPDNPEDHDFDLELPPRTIDTSPIEFDVD